MNNRNKIIVAVVAVLGVIAVVVGSIFLTKQSPQAEDASGHSATTSSAPETAAPSDSPSPTFESSCTTTIEGFVPVRYTIEGSMSVDEQVLALDVDEDNAIAAPPPSEKRAASWWNQGPRPGGEGKTVLAIHTYRNGGALGNEMYENGESQLKPGDMIKLYGANGEVACYEFTEAKKVMVEEYDEDSDVMIDFEGDREVAMIICWDFSKDADEEAGEDPWKSRVFFYGKLV